MTKPGLMGKKIPTVFGLLILIGGLVAGVILVSQRQGLGTKAGPTESPKNVRITNRATNSFSVAWTTDTPTTGFVKYSENPAKITLPAGDVRDQISGTAQAYTNHYVNISGLGADKTYYFVIGSGPKTYNDEGKPFQIRTGPQVAPVAEDVISGKVVNAAAAPVNGAIVIVEPQGGEALSSVTKVDGTWRLNLAGARDKSGQVLTYDKDKTVLSVFVQGGTGGTATAMTNTSKDSPIPDITLGKNLSFIDTLPVAMSEPEIVNKGSFGSLVSAPAPAVEIQLSDVATDSVKVLNPAIEGEMIATSSPEFRGTAIPNGEIKITVESDPQTAVIKADSSGDWKWTAPKSLAAGIHTLTLEYTDAGGVLRKIERTFTVLAYESTGGLPSFTATPSATPTVSITPTPTASPTAEILPEPAEPTLTPEVAMPATSSSQLAKTGNEWVSYLLAVGGVGLFFVGKLTKKWVDNNR